VLNYDDMIICMNWMLIVLLLLNLYVKMGRYEHDEFLYEVDDEQCCGC
jgi:hypothetical protein